MNFQKLIVIILFAIYFFMPLDFIPDFLFPYGYFDDFVFLLLVLFGKKSLKDFFMMKKNQTLGAKTQRESPKKERQESQSPWEVLGIRETSNVEEIKEAYRKKCAEYHPDKVASLGVKLQETAHEEFKKIQKAYEEIKKIKRFK